MVESESMQETLEVQSSIKKFPWLIQMVKSKLFHKLCDQHITKKRCYFCCECMVPPLCDLCYKKNDHKDHTMIQTYRSSYQSGIRKETISKYMDISGIHIYTINSYPIIYINQRRENDDHRSRNKVLHKCQVCEWELDSSSDALFCSIECKLKNVLGSKLDDMMMEKEDIEPVKPKRRHRRKGIPCRAGQFGFQFHSNF